MKILYVIEKLSGFGGMERIYTDKMNYLAEHTGHEIILLLLWHDPKPPVFELNPKIRIIHLNVPMVRGGWTFPLVVWRYNRLVSQLQPDVTDLSFVAGAVLGAFGRHRGKVIFESHQTRHTMRHSWLFPLLERRDVKVVCLTREDASEFRHAIVIPNFTTLKPLSTPPDTSLKHCVWAGRLNYAKNLPKLLRIWACVVQKHPDWTLDLFGDGEERQAVEAMIEQLHLSHSVVMHGSSQDMPKAYRTGSIFLLTSHFEGFSIVLIEAATCGLPIISTDCPYGPRNIIQNGVNGMLCSNDEDEPMIEAICQAIENPTLRQQMSTEALRMARDYQPAPIMAKWLKLFNA